MLKLFRSAAVLTVLVAAACSDSIGPGDVAGTYTLREVNNDETPPFVVFDDGDERTEIVSGDFVIRADGTFTSTLVLRETFQGETFPDNPLESSGTYDLDGRDITFEDSDFGDTLVGRISGDNLIFDDPGIRLVFTR
ncbi:MAG TPA: hypothetical protein VNO75_09320 [Gemmatimonadaceae bacterium]|nr:hypothetical protein [Gemmatimonadaceae bacterium]